MNQQNEIAADTGRKRFLHKWQFPIVILFACFLCAFVWWIYKWVLPEHIVPTTPVYPDAVQIDYSVDSLRLGRQRTCSINYKTSASPDEVLDYYSNRANCLSTPHMLCFGTAFPFGRYDVSIKEFTSQDALTIFHIDIWW